MQGVNVFSVIDQHFFSMNNPILTFLLNVLSSSSFAASEKIRFVLTSQFLVYLSSMTI